jgi:hypothetical protein
MISLQISNGKMNLSARNLIPDLFILRIRYRPRCKTNSALSHSLARSSIPRSKDRFLPTSMQRPMHDWRRGHLESLFTFMPHLLHRFISINFVLASRPPTSDPAGSPLVNQFQSFRDSHSLYDSFPGDSASALAVALVRSILGLSNRSILKIFLCSFNTSESFPAALHIRSKSL